MNLSNIVAVTIDRQTAAVTAAGFGLPMFLGLHAAFTERLRTYESADAVGVDFGTAAPEYKAAQKFFGQEVSVAKIAIGRRNATNATLTPTVQNSAAYSVTINGTLFTFTSDASALATEIVAGLVALINADAVLPITASGSNTLVLTPDVANTAFSLKFSSNFTVTYGVTETLTDAAVAIATENNKWYGLTAYTHTKADILELAAYAQSAKKIYGTSSADADNYGAVGSDTTSVLKALKDAGYDRTYLLFSTTANSEFPECAWMGGEFARDPGKATWKYKTLAGVTVSNLTSTQSSNILAKNGNTYEEVGGQNVTHNGTTSTGEFIDVIRDTDWLIARIQERIFASLVNLPKIPYTATGLAIIESALRAQLLEAVDRGVLADDTAFTVSIPKLSSINPNDRAARLLPDVKFTARIAGSIHNVVVAGIVTV